MDDWTMDDGRWTMDDGRWTMDWTMDDGRWTMDDGRWTMDDGRWTMDDGRWTMDDGRWTVDYGPFYGHELNTRLVQDISCCVFSMFTIASRNRFVFVKFWSHRPFGSVCRLYFVIYGKV